jgi:hypothetical protein
MLFNFRWRSTKLDLKTELNVRNRNGTGLSLSIRTVPSGYQVS